MSVNINTTNNIVSVQTDNNSVIVTNNNTGTTVNVSRPIASVVTVSSPGPQGAVGPQGIQGETGPPTPFTNIGSGVYSTTSSIQISGSFLVSGSSTFTNIGPAIFSGSVTISDSLTVNGFNVITSNQTSSLTSLSASYANTSSYAYYAETGLTSSYATTAGTANAVTQLNQNVVITGNLNVFGTASYNYVTASQLDVGTSYISVNIAEPGERFGGLKVYDSGSLSHQATASLSWDSQNNHWIYQNASGSTYSGGMLISGPRNTDAIGNEQGTTNNALMKGQGGDHITSSRIFEDASGNVTIGASGPGFYWDNTNSRLGIGTATPATTLQIAGTATLRAILPELDNTYNIGSATFRYNNIYARAILSGASTLDLYSTISSFFDSVGNRRMTIVGSSGNVIIGSSATDAGFRLDVSGSVRFRGSGSASTTSALTVQNSSGTTLLNTRDDGLVTIGVSGWLGIGETGRYLYRALNATGIFTIANDSTIGSSIDMFGSSHATLPNLIRVTAPASLQITGSLGVSNTASFNGLSLHNQNRIDDVSMLNFDTTNNYYQVGKSGNDLLIRTAANNLALFAGKDTTIQTGVIGGHFYFKGGNVNGFGQSNFSIADYNGSNTRFFVSGSGNVGIGTATPAYTLDVNGTARVNGLMVFANNSQINGSGNLSIGAFSIHSSFGFATFSNNVTLLLTGQTFTSTTGTQTGLSFTGGFAPTSGTATYSGFSILPTINQTGGANGVTRGLFINPTISSSVDFRAIETTSGSVIFNSGSVGIGTSTPATTLQIAGTTTTQNILVQTGATYDIGVNATRFRDAWFSRNVNCSTIWSNNVGFGSTNLTFYNTSVATVGTFFGTGNLLLSTDTQTDAGYRLAINSSGSLSGSLYITGSSNQTLLRVDSNASSNIVFISGSGNVGIGTATPGVTLDVVGNIRASGTVFNSTTQTQIIQINSGVSALRFFSGSVETARYDGNNWGFYTTTPTARLQVKGSGATNATTTFLLQNSTPTNLLSVLDNGQVSFTSPTMSLAVSQSAFSISPIISASNIVGGQYYGVNITPTFFQTTGSQTETAFRVAATYNQTSAVATGGTNIIADFGSTSAGSQLTVTDVTSGSIYMVNDVSGLPIIEATSNWDVNIYDFPNKVFEKTGSQVNIYGTMRVSGSFILPLSQSATPQIGSAYWSGSLLFIYNGTRYMSASFA